MCSSHLIRGRVTSTSNKSILTVKYLRFDWNQIGDLLDDWLLGSMRVFRRPIHGHPGAQSD